MFIPMHHSQVDAVPSSGGRLLGRARHDRRSRAMDVRQLGEYGALFGRVSIVACGGLAFVWQTLAHTSFPLLAAALLIAALALVANVFRRMPVWAALLIDGAAIGLLALATGGIASPFVFLAGALVILGGLLGGERDATVGAGIGLVLLLLVAVLGETEVGNRLIAVLAVYSIISIAAIWLVHQARIALSGLAEAAEERQRADRDSGDARRLIEWQQQNLARVNSCTTAAELAQCALERATAITGAPATLDHLSGFTPRGWYAIPLNGTDRLVIHRTTLDLSRPQREALDHLTETVRHRVDALRLADALRRHNDALIALWEVAGFLRSASSLSNVALEACRRIAGALELEWLAFLTPDEQQALAPLLLVRGKADGAAPRMQPADIRVANEALRGGRSLVRTEQGVTLACLPVRLGGETSLVLVARGVIDEAALQALLMVFGDLVAERLAGVRG